MKVDIKIEEEACRITFYLKELSQKGHLTEALMIIESLAGSFDIDPEMDEKDIEMLKEEAQESGHDHFFIDIDEEGVSGEA